MDLIEATVTLDGTDEVITSPTTGVYSFAGLDAQHDVTVEKDDGVNEWLYDASLVLVVVGVALSGPALIAADLRNGLPTGCGAILEVAAGHVVFFVNQDRRGSSHHRIQL